MLRVVMILIMLLSCGCVCTRVLVILLTFLQEREDFNYFVSEKKTIKKTSINISNMICL